MVVCDGEVFVCQYRNVWLSCFSQAHLLPHYIFFINSWESLYSLTSRSGVLLQSCRLPKFQSSEIYFPEIDLQFLSKCMPCPHLRHFLALKSKLSIFMFATVKITMIIHRSCHAISISRYVVKGYLLLAIITSSYYFHSILSN